jgi:tRNA nucleotidyltransferase (CCA-adding enzyme)
MIPIPPEISFILEKLRSAGFEAQPVGGCVRDSLLGLAPGDWDICTSALPEEVVALFGEENTIPTGLKHGTVTVRSGARLSEVTTYRTDGAYTDHRRPDEVRFIASLAEDLKRRDFTVNAMAYSPETGLTDLFGGREDLKNRLIRCVGDPDLRFGEDALRILRALRFAAVLGFEIEPATAAAVMKSADNLKHISAERIFVELKKLLAGESAADILLRFRPVIEICLPALCSLSPAAYEEAARAAGKLRDPVLSFAALLRPAGQEAADKTCRDLKTDNKFRACVCFLAERCDTLISTPGQARRTLGEHGEARSLQLLRFREALGRPADALNGVCAEPQTLPTRLADLRIGGADLAALGVTGKDVGRILEALLEQASDGTLPNVRDALLRAATKPEEQ